MALKLTKIEVLRISSLVDRLRNAQEHLNKKVSEINTEIGKLNNQLIEEYDYYNAVINDSESHLEDIRDRLNGELDERSEGFKDSDRGLAASEWVGRFSEISFEQIDTPSLDPVDVQDVAEDLASELEDLTQEPE